MPRVTEEYRTARRAEILSAAGELFARNGFHATSMADIISASGLSAGAVYRYFRSKEELIGSVADVALGSADEVAARMLADGAVPSPATAIGAMLDNIVHRVAREAVPGVDLTRIVIQVWAESARNPALAERVHQAFEVIRGCYAEVARRRQAAGLLPADADPLQVASAMLGVSQGFLVQNLLIPGTTIDGYLAGVRPLLGD
ncbi:TetR/AcrR family transcriptional regulator [Kineosporia succinea]|uniref:AcrR family transcriptional regulator n=1 Tax=Kineosporia succinea TaxID=84632 RepID=A0ABT9PAY5_9ACTN|nr:TetR/AcrR family transcriptional regulator [Kineosporia succinea]MDP9829864.1 AcrR family transcriptional regulator [Kineosporia succinea]